MKVSMDGLRKNIARAWNDACHNRTDENMDELRMHIANLLAVYDDEIDGDVNDLSDDVYLARVYPE